MSSNNIKGVYYGFIVLFLLSIIILSIIISKDVRDYVSVKKNPVETEATVNALFKDNFGKYPSYNAELKYYSVNDSSTILSKYRRVVNVKDFKIGSKISIVYDGTNPKNFFIIGKSVIKETLIGITSIFMILCLMIVFRKKIFAYYNS